MSDSETPDETKLTRTKRLWAEEGRFLTGRGGNDRLPPGQHLVQNWPVLDLGEQPSIDAERWRLAVDGLVSKPLFLDWDAYLSLAKTEQVTDIHCVTTWSRYDNTWRGLATRDLIELVDPAEEAQAVTLHSYDGYTTNLKLEDFAAPHSMLVHEWNGAPLPPEHGGPLRIVVPHLYFWKSAKWLSRIEFIPKDRPGFWEKNGYHMRGDPWNEERYS